MERLFQTHQIRYQEELDGIWKFQPLDTCELPAHYSDSIVVPGCWEMNIVYCRYRGLAAYCREITVNRTGNIRLLFKGISHTGRVYLDGKYIGTHYNAYTAFSLVVPDVEKGTHRLEVIVDNRWIEESTLHIPNDYYTYGGITRSVYLEYLPDIFIKSAKWTPFLTEDGWRAKLEITVVNLSREAQRCEIEAECGGEHAQGELNIQAGKETVYTAEILYQEVDEWFCNSPALYTLRICLNQDGEATDDLTERVGFRTVEERDGKILLNGKAVFLKGVNRHEDHGICGCAIPLSVMDSDMKMIEAVGANAVRTCHYPNDEKFLDLCDEHGILVWEESHDRGGDAKRMTNPLFAEQSMTVMHEMLEQHYNHPSIIIWGCLNEAASDEPEGAEIYQMHFDYLKADPSRLHTYASDKYKNPQKPDLCLGMEDVCSFNMYPYWYGDDSVDDLLGKMRKQMAESGNSGKPIIISEYGGGGVYNFHDVMHVKWSEEYQAELLTRVTKELFLQPDIAGVFVWQFCDVRISQEGERNWPMSRPLSRNNKGIVDEYRRPKLAYYALKKAFGER
ncbi:MAG: hypothetical protein LUH58_08490 [Lachnospiraceae bacterium]|nr:hypothetical protein [Lachnospiraceae bacterium]